MRDGLQHDVLELGTDDTGPGLSHAAAATELCSAEQARLPGSAAEDQPWNERVAELAALEILAQVRVDRAPTCADLGGSLGDQASAVLWKQDEAVRILDKGGDGAPALFDYVAFGVGQVGRGPRTGGQRVGPAQQQETGSHMGCELFQSHPLGLGCPVGRFDVAEHACSRRHVQDAQVAAQLRIRVGLGILNPFVDVVGSGAEGCRHHSTPSGIGAACATVRVRASSSQSVRTRSNNGTVQRLRASM